MALKFPVFSVSFKDSCTIKKERFFPFQGLRALLLPVSGIKVLKYFAHCHSVILSILSICANSFIQCWPGRETHCESKVPRP